MLVHDSGGRELMLKPGLNIIGGVQPRGVNEVIAIGIFDILVAVEIIGMLESLEMLDTDMATAVNFEASEGDEVAVGVITISGAMELIAMLESAGRDVSCIPDILIEELGLNPRPVPA